MTEIIAKIDGESHKFGYLSADGDYLTLQKISQNMNKGITYIRQIEAIDYRFNITTKGEFSIDNKSLDLDEFSQLIALGIDSDKIAPYVDNDARLPDKPTNVVKMNEPFILSGSNLDNIPFIVVSASLELDWSQCDQRLLTLEARAVDYGYRIKG